MTSKRENIIAIISGIALVLSLIFMTIFVNIFDKNITFPDKISVVTLGVITISGFVVSICFCITTIIDLIHTRRKR